MIRRRGVFVAAVVLVLLAAGGIAAALLLHRGSAADAGPPPVTGGAPRPALDTIERLTSARVAAQRNAVTPELASLLPPGRLFPKGTSFTPIPHGWHRSGAYANIIGVLREPGRSATRAEIGLVLRQGHWLVTFEEQL